ncbi:MAG TPA: hypothetical protein VI522_00360, partial [Gammaproteobacteria bacterium]|nr:hypothetical protein [Gammaproteobacteria bacterium]
SRSEKDPVPTAGHWDLYGSNIWINGTAVTPPKYTNAGVTITKEVALKNENFTGRDPIWVTLNKGWNKVLLKLPYINAAYRLDKWMFTFVFTDVNGYAAVDDLVYSPNQLLDENAEEVAIAISDARQIRNKYVKDKPGYSVTSAATTLNATLEKIEKTLTRRC